MFIFVPAFMSMVRGGERLSLLPGTKGPELPERSPECVEEEHAMTATHPASAGNLSSTSPLVCPVAELP